MTENDTIFDGGLIEPRDAPPFDFQFCSGLLVVRAGQRQRSLMPTIVEKLQDRLAYPPRLMDEIRAAAYVGFGTTKFGELVDEGIMPPPVVVDGSPRWDRFDLDSSVDNLKDRRRDPVTRDRDRLEQRIHAMEEGAS
jgi:hypothetical protein